MSTSAAQDQEERSQAEARRVAVRRTWGILSGLAPGRRLSDELIAERREEARREAARS